MLRFCMMAEVEPYGFTNFFLMGDKMTFLVLRSVLVFKSFMGN